MTDVKSARRRKPLPHSGRARAAKRAKAKNTGSRCSPMYSRGECGGVITFEDRVHLDHTGFIDGFIPATHVLIEQKGIDKDLRKPIKQSAGMLLTPFQQAKRHAAELPYSQRPRWIVTCNFKEFLVYDMEIPTGEPEEILLVNLEKEYYRLQFLVDTDSDTIKKEMVVSIQAGNLVGVLYDEILKQYIDPTNPESLKCLNMLCVRLVFCLYAEDAGIFGGYSMFHDYLHQFPAREVRRALIGLFKTLDTKEADRTNFLVGSVGIEHTTVYDQLPRHPFRGCPRLRRRCGQRFRLRYG